MNTLSKEKICLDIATEKCPCALASTSECPACGFLNQTQCCDCSQSWAGLCIYQAYLDNGVQSK